MAYDGINVGAFFKQLLPYAIALHHIESEYNLTLGGVSSSDLQDLRCTWHDAICMTYQHLLRANTVNS